MKAHRPLGVIRGRKANICFAGGSAIVAVSQNNGFFDGVVPFKEMKDVIFGGAKGQATHSEEPSMFTNLDSTAGTFLQRRVHGLSGASHLHRMSLYTGLIMLRYVTIGCRRCQSCCLWSGLQSRGTRAWIASFLNIPIPLFSQWHGTHDSSSPFLLPHMLYRKSSESWSAKQVRNLIPPPGSGKQRRGGKIFWQRTRAIAL